MKKGILFLMIVGIFLGITGCKVSKDKVVTTVDDFEVAASNNGFEVIDNTEQYTNSGDMYLSSRMATKGNVEVDMVVYDSVETAESVLEGHMESFKNLKSTAAAEKNEEGNNYHYYSLVSNNYYMKSVRVDNTLVFCKVLITQKDTVDKIFEEIGY